MTKKILLPGLLAFGLCSPALAEPAAKAIQARQMIRWPGGWMYLDQPGVIYLDGALPQTGSTTVVTNSANGVGNRIVIDNGRSSGTTILSNVRNGIGNSVTVTPKGPVLEPKPDKVPETEKK